LYFFKQIIIVREIPEIPEIKRKIESSFDNITLTYDLAGVGFRNGLHVAIGRALVIVGGLLCTVVADFLLIVRVDLKPGSML
jgi:hypothetical protein